MNYTSIQFYPQKCKPLNCISQGAFFTKKARPRGLTFLYYAKYRSYQILLALDCVRNIFLHFLLGNVKCYGHLAVQQCLSLSQVLFVGG